MTEQTLAPIKGKLREIAQHAVEEKQRLSPGYTLTLEAHKKLAKTTPTGVSSLQAFRDQAPGVEDQDLIKGLQLASDVGILQYYRQIEPEIVLTDPLFLMQALGVLLYDKETFKTYFTGLRERERERERGIDQDPSFYLSIYLYIFSKAYQRACQRICKEWPTSCSSFLLPSALARRKVSKKVCRPCGGQPSLDTRLVSPRHHRPSQHL